MSRSSHVSWRRGQSALAPPCAAMRTHRSAMQLKHPASLPFKHMHVCMHMPFALRTSCPRHAPRPCETCPCATPSGAMQPRYSDSYSEVAGSSLDSQQVRTQGDRGAGAVQALPCAGAWLPVSWGPPGPCTANASSPTRS